MINKKITSVIDGNSRALPGKNQTVDPTPVCVQNSTSSKSHKILLPIVKVVKRSVLRVFELRVRP